MRALIAVAFVLAGCANVPTPDEAQNKPPELDYRAQMVGAVQVERHLSGANIIATAHMVAGGESWVRPQSLKLSGYNIIRSSDGGEVLWDRYTMWRVYADAKTDAHAANGKVRIEGWTGDTPTLLLAFDGETTYTAEGPIPDQSGNAMWSNSFGFGAIRNALDEGWSQDRRPDRMIDGQLAHMVELTDPSGGKTLFGIDAASFVILYVGFNTPRGWHERYYSHFFTKPGVDWIQPGRVRLFYNGVKANEAIWTDFELNPSFDDDLFVVTPD